jgi:hypothetical protein
MPKPREFGIQDLDGDGISFGRPPIALRAEAHVADFD